MTEIEKSIRRTLRFLVGATIVLYIGVALIAGFTLRTAANVEDSLCSLRADLEQRVESSERFLAEHPQGIPGIPASQIREGIANQRRTIIALSDLDC